MTKILVIEDEELLRESILSLLSKRGFRATGAKDGRVGLQLAKEIVPNLILCNVRIPELNGYEVLGALRQDQITAKIPFVFLTAENSADVLLQGRILGANGYIAKPFTTVELLEVIATHLKNSG